VQYCFKIKINFNEKLEAVFTVEMVVTVKAKMFLCNIFKEHCQEITVPGPALRGACSGLPSGVGPGRPRLPFFIGRLRRLCIFLY